MDLQTLAVAVLSSGVVGMVVGYFLNRRFEVAKAELQETARRQAALFDHQKDALLKISEMSYRLRNDLRDAAGTHPGIPEDLLQQVEAAQADFEEALYNSRAILPEYVFQLAHDMKEPVMKTTLLLRKIRKLRAQGRKVAARETAHLGAALKTIEAQFRQFVEESRSHIGVGDDTPRPSLDRMRRARSLGQFR